MINKSASLPLSLDYLCIIVPVYNNPLTIAKVVSQIKEVCDLTLIIVDDGSDVPVESLIPPSKSIIHVRQFPNRGKGVALRCGALKAQELGMHHCITMDGDGQHFAHDLHRFIEIYSQEQDPHFMVIGVRDFAECTPPSSSVIGRQIGNFWVWIESGTWVSDTQTGFRLYPLDMLAYESRTTRYEFEIENLVRFLWKKGRILETRVKTVYDDSRVSHFDKIKDNLFMIALHARLVIQRILLLRGIV